MFLYFFCSSFSFQASKSSSALSHPKVTSVTSEVNWIRVLSRSYRRHTEVIQSATSSKEIKLQRRPKTSNAMPRSFIRLFSVVIEEKKDSGYKDDSRTGE